RPLSQPVRYKAHGGKDKEAYRRQKDPLLFLIHPLPRFLPPDRFPSLRHRPLPYMRPLLRPRPRDRPGNPPGKRRRPPLDNRPGYFFPSRFFAAPGFRPPRAHTHGEGRFHKRSSPPEAPAVPLLLPQPE